MVVCWIFRRKNWIIKGTYPLTFLHQNRPGYGWRDGSAVSALAVFEEDLDSVPSRRMVAHKVACTFSSRDLMPSFGASQTHSASQIHVGKHTYTNNENRLS